MKEVSQPQKHLGQSVAMGVLLVLTSASIITLMTMHSGALR